MNKRIYLVEWEQAKKLIKARGLGLRSISSSNKALHYMVSGFDHTVADKNPFGLSLWKSILSSSQHVQNNSK